MLKTPVRNRKSRKYDKTFIFMIEDSLLDAIKRTAEDNYMSVATFLRQSASRNIDAYNKYTERNAK